MLMNILNEKIENIINDETAMGCCGQDNGCGCKTPQTRCCENTCVETEFSFEVVMRASEAPAVGTNVPISITDENLTAVRDIYEITDIKIPNPCNPCKTICAAVNLNRYRYVGAIVYSASIPIDNDSSCQCPTYMCNQGTALIDQAICYSSEDVVYPLPTCDFIDGCPTAQVSNVCTSCNGYVVVTIEVELQFNSPCCNY